MAEAMPQSFEDLIQTSELPVFVDFWAEWCGPCRMIAPSVKKLAEEMTGKLVVVKVNVDEKPQLAQAHGIMGIPTLIMFHKGKEIWRASGALPYDSLKYQVEANLPA
ncbi:thioredoxin [Chloroherpeton thalassium ATCC 35110]|uniref:Thioredoxin n=1 Tax=Chloroherpeton thalassium (strain ATCC 35110 / GB-78) TaxID=517418 RepID=B3QXP2_CHLT3|nr:thioredoxin [Chloroherpeton thalassium ATCC 35110]